MQFFANYQFKRPLKVFCKFIRLLTRNNYKPSSENLSINNYFENHFSNSYFNKKYCMLKFQFHWVTCIIGFWSGHRRLGTATFLHSTYIWIWYFNIVQSNIQLTHIAWSVPNFAISSFISSLFVCKIAENIFITWSRVFPNGGSSLPTVVVIVGIYTSKG